MTEIKQIKKVGWGGGYLSTGIWWSMCHSNTLYSEAQLKGNGGLSIEGRPFRKITLRRPLDEKGSM